ncbi:hypothetical protein BOX15_Mlig025296g1, partial [Macrostomum lignano]
GQEAVYYKADQRSRPVPLKTLVLGYHRGAEQSAFKFDMNLNYRLAGLVAAHAEAKPALIFCISRKSTEQVCSVLQRDLQAILARGSCLDRDVLQQFSARLSNKKLRDSLSSGVAFHHAGLSMEDRKCLEEAFLTGCLPVLACTSTLAMGVNLPAHLVIIKGTQLIAGSETHDYDSIKVHQMIGRAGRPQFDTSATAIIMTSADKQPVYEEIVNGTQLIESSLHHHLTEYLNAEIVLQTITCVSSAVSWLHNTFLGVRLPKNPAYYGSQISVTAGWAERLMMERLQQLAQLELISASDLASSGDIGAVQVSSRPAGRLMARHCVKFASMRRICELQPDASLEALVRLVAECLQLEAAEGGSFGGGDGGLRVSDRRPLNQLAKGLRFRPATGGVKTAADKALVLLQAELASATVADFSLAQDAQRMMALGGRLARCLVDVWWDRGAFGTLTSAILLSKSFKARLWENSDQVSRQLPGIGPVMAAALAAAGFASFARMAAAAPHELEAAAGRRPPFGASVLSAVNGLPRYLLGLEESPVGDGSEIRLSISLANRPDLLRRTAASPAGRRALTAGPGHTCVLLVGDARNRLLLRARLRDDRLIWGGADDAGASLEAQFRLRLPQPAGPEDPALQLTIALLSETWAGFDLLVNYEAGGSGVGVQSPCFQPAQAASGPGKPGKPQPQSGPNGKRQRGGKQAALDDFGFTPVPAKKRTAESERAAQGGAQGLQQTPQNRLLEFKPRAKPQLQPVLASQACSAGQLPAPGNQTGFSFSGQAQGCNSQVDIAGNLCGQAQSFSFQADPSGQSQYFNSQANLSGQPQGFNRQANLSGQPQGFNGQANLSGQPQGFNGQANLSGQPQGFNSQANLSGQPQGFNSQANLSGSHCGQLQGLKTQNSSNQVSFGSQLRPLPSKCGLNTGYPGSLSGPKVQNFRSQQSINGQLKSSASQSRSSVQSQSSAFEPTSDSWSLRAKTPANLSGQLQSFNPQANLSGQSQSFNPQANLSGQSQSFNPRSIAQASASQQASQSLYQSQDKDSRPSQKRAFTFKRRSASGSQGASTVQSGTNNRSADMHNRAWAETPQYQLLNLESQDSSSCQARDKPKAVQSDPSAGSEQYDGYTSRCSEQDSSIRGCVEESRFQESPVPASSATSNASSGQRFQFKSLSSARRNQTAAAPESNHLPPLLPSPLSPPLRSPSPGPPPSPLPRSPSPPPPPPVPAVSSISDWSLQVERALLTSGVFPVVASDFEVAAPALDGDSLVEGQSDLPCDFAGLWDMAADEDDEEPILEE